jgi:hypothetical protein
VYWVIDGVMFPKYWVLGIAIVCLIIGYGIGRQSAFREDERADQHERQQKRQAYRNRNKRQTPANRNRDKNR